MGVTDRNECDTTSSSAWASSDLGNSNRVDELIDNGSLSNCVVELFVVVAVAAAVLVVVVVEVIVLW